MKLFNIRKSQKGFTLVELVLVIGLITMMTIGIYLKYRSISTDTNIQLQTQDLYAISNKITNAYQSATAIGTFDNNVVVPRELINGSTIINRFGGTITLTATTINSTPGYEIRLNNISNNICGLIGTSKYANEADEVWINGVSQKATGTALTPLNRSSITTACSSASSNTIGFRNRMYYGVSKLDYAQTRKNQTDKYYIPTIANNINSVSTACSGNSSWTGSFCSCPVGTEWNGNTCEVNTKGSNCVYGTAEKQGESSCKELPVTTAQSSSFNGTNIVVQNNTYYSAANPTSRAACDAASGYWDATTNMCGGILPTQVAGTKTSQTPVYQGGRYFPQALNAQMISQIPVNTVQGFPAQCASSGGNWDGKMCNFCPAPTTINSVNTVIVNAKTGTQEVGNMGAAPVPTTTSNPALNGHAVASSWNVDRCVTPAAVTNGTPPYPQTVTW